jgi:Ca-activated chloride channel family protein
VKFSAQLDVQVVAVEAADEVSVLVDLMAPTVSTSKERRPATLQVVLDRSGSMAGPPLTGAIEALCALVARLDDRDNFGVVVFDNATQVVVPAGPLSDKPRVVGLLKQVEPGGMTDLSGGYLRGLQELKRVAVGGGGTLLLISDGHANQGVTDPSRLADIAASAVGERIVTSTLGYGLGYDETALVAMARGGSGNHHFAKDPDQAGAAIASEVGELLDKSVQAASLLITMEPAVALAQLFNDLPCHRLGHGAVMVELGDLYSGEQRKLLLRFAVPAMASLGLAQIVSLELRYIELPGLVEHVVTVPVQVNVVPGDEAAGRVVDPTVHSEVLFQEAQQAKRAASEALEHGHREMSTAYFQAAGAKIAQALSVAPDALVDDLLREQSDVADLHDRSRRDDTNRLSKESRASYHAANRKRGRRPSDNAD